MTTPTLPPVLQALLQSERAEICTAGPKPFKERNLYRLRHWWLGAAAGLSMAVGVIGLGSTSHTQAQTFPHDDPTRVYQAVDLPAPDLSLLLDVQTNLQYEKQADPLHGLDLTGPKDTWPAQLLEQGHGFLALTAHIEAIAERPYWDNCGVNVGVGYCIRARVRNHGEEVVRENLAQAGLPLEHIETLLYGNKWEQRQLRFTPEESLRLLFLTEGDYTDIAKQAIGVNVFEKMPPQKQQALSWLAYNLGDGLYQYKQLIHAIHQENWAEAMQHMTPHFKEGDTWRRNNRAASYLMAVFASEEGLAKVLADPHEFERAVQTGQSPVEWVNPEWAKQLERKGQLPLSPYLIGDDLQDTRAWRTERLQSQRVASHEPQRIKPHG